MISARASSGILYLMFSGVDTYWKFFSVSVADMLSGSYDSQGSMMGYYPDLGGKEPDACYKHEGDIFFIVGECHFARHVRVATGR